MNILPSKGNTLGEGGYYGCIHGALKNTSLGLGILNHDWLSLVLRSSLVLKISQFLQSLKGIEFQPRIRTSKLEHISRCFWFSGVLRELIVRNHTGGGGWGNSYKKKIA